MVGGRFSRECLNFETSQVSSEAIFGHYRLSTALASSSNVYMQYPSTKDGKLHSILRYVESSRGFTEK